MTVHLCDFCAQPRSLVELEEFGLWDHGPFMVCHKCIGDVRLRVADMVRNLKIRRPEFKGGAE